MERLYVKDEDIKTINSSFKLYNDEMLKLELNKEVSYSYFKDSIYIRNPSILDAINIEILMAIDKLKFCTTRQLTEFLYLTKGIELTESSISKRLNRLGKYAIVSRYAIIKKEANTNNKEEVILASNMRIYFLKHNATRILNDRCIPCNWRGCTDLGMDNIKNILVANQYIIKLYKELGIKNVKVIFNSKISGVKAICEFPDGTNHVVIPIRNNDFTEKLKWTIQAIRNDAYLTSLKKDKFIILGPDMQQNFKALCFLTNTLKIDLKKVYFSADLDLFRRPIQDLMHTFSQKTVNDKIQVVANQVKCEEFNINS